MYFRGQTHPDILGELSFGLSWPCFIVTVVVDKAILRTSRAQPSRHPEFSYLGNFPPSHLAETSLAPDPLLRGMVRMGQKWV